MAVTTMATVAASIAVEAGTVGFASRYALPVDSDPWLWLKACAVGLVLFVVLFVAGTVVKRLSAPD